jgi:hypothetical protein
VVGFDADAVVLNPALQLLGIVYITAVEDVFRFHQAATTKVGVWTRATCHDEQRIGINQSSKLVFGGEMLPPSECWASAWPRGRRP